jgi:outer membrane protein OmpA-like peptidoglycan-associated protein
MWAVVVLLLSSCLYFQASAPDRAAATTLTCAQGGACAVGDTGPGGGVVFYVSNTSFPCGVSLTDNCTYLEKAPASGVSIMDWSVNYSTTLIGATAQNSAIGSGAANTAAIVAQNGTYNASTNNYEAGFAQSYSNNGLSDWYLPSKDELTALYTYESNTASPDTWFIYGYFFNSSTEYDATHLWGIGMWPTGQTIVNGVGKTDNNWIIAIRAFSAMPTPNPKPVPVPDPPQSNQIESISPTSGPTTGSTVDVTGSFNGPRCQISNISIDNKFLPRNSWTVDASSVSFAMPAHAAGDVQIIIWDGCVPVLSPIAYTYKDQVTTPVPSITPIPAAPPIAIPETSTASVPSASSSIMTTSRSITNKSSPTDTKLLTVHFSLNSFRLSNADKRELKLLATQIMKSSDQVVAVYGHADAQKGLDNTLLSKNRAIIVGTFLKNLLPQMNIVLKWFGSSKPIASGNSQHAYSLNRRSEVWLKS